MSEVEVYIYDGRIRVERAALKMQRASRSTLVLRGTGVSITVRWPQYPTAEQLTNLRARISKDAAFRTALVAEIVAALFRGEPT